MSKLETGLHYPLKLDVLPEAWRIGHVGDFADEIQPGFASGKHNKEGAGIPHIRPYNIDRQGKLDLTEIKSVAPESDAKRLRTGDVLFNNTNSPELIGKTTVIASAEDWGFSNHMTRIRFKDDVAPKFAAYQLHFLWMTGYYLHNCVKHVNQASISSKTLANAVPFIAPPFDQQKRIVAEIEKQFSRLDEAVANLKRVKANLKRYKAAVLKAAVSGRLVETEAELARREGRSYETGAQLLQRILETRRGQWKGKGKYKEPAAPDTTDLPKLPEGWTWCGFEQVSVADKHALKAGPFGSALKKELYVESGYKIYGQEQVIRGDSKFGDYFIDETKFRELESCAVKPGDLLISLVGTAGKVLVLPQNTMPGIINPRLLKLSLNHSHISPEYAAYMLQSSLASHYFKLQAHGGTMEILNLGIIKALPVPLPPAAEQQRIVAEVDRRFSFLRQIEAQVDVNLQRRTVGLQQTILVHAFAGHHLWDGAVSGAHEMR